MNVERRDLDLNRRPEDVFASLSHRRGVFFLDSGLEVAGAGRHSYLGFEPYAAFCSQRGRCRLWRNGEVSDRDIDALELLRELLREQACPHIPELPFPGGAVGYLSYEYGASFERVTSPHPDELGTPEAEFGFYDGVLIYDHAAGRWSAVANTAGGRPLDEVFAGLERAVTAEPQRPADEFKADQRAEETASFGREDYAEAIGRIKGYIASGDVYQVNLTQRFSVPLRQTAPEVHLALRRLCPAPYACYFRGENLELVSSSPEGFLRVRGSRVETRPIKGTRRRGHSPAEDARLADELLASTKDRAELLMIVDLVRNDLGRVCVPGSVQVAESRRIEHHPTVHHLAATVAGELRPGCDTIDCVRAAFPGGSITGAPKIRAMQIIAELEKTQRGVYTGSIGFFGFDGGCELNIAIRTVICRDGMAYYHVGGGIVWDSEPAAEYQETLDKGAAMRAVLLGASREERPYEPWASLNGRLVPPSEASVSALGEGFLFGCGLFETMRVENGSTAYFEEHWARVVRSAAALGLDWCGDCERTRRECEAVVAANRLEVGSLKLVVWREADRVGELILARRGLYPKESYARGFRLVREAAVSRGPLAGHKTLNYWGNIDAKRRAVAAGFDEPVFVTAAGEVLEGATSNVFLVRNGTVTTPLADGRLLPGVMRGRVIRLLGEKIEERTVTERELLEADEVFLTNALLGVMPVSAFGGRSFDLRENPVTREMMRAAGPAA